jgi:hypothetical protein
MRSLRYVHMRSFALGAHGNAALCGTGPLVSNVMCWMVTAGAIVTHRLGWMQSELMSILGRHCA